MKTIRFLFIVSISLAACKTSNNSEQVAKGEELFQNNCSACHNFRSTGIGPQLGGITESADTSWIRKFILDPKGMIEGGDERAQQQFSRFNTYMPGFAHLKDDEVNAIIEFLKTKPAPPKKDFKVDGTELKDPITEKIPMSDLVINLTEVATIPPSASEGQLTRICKLDIRPDTKEIFVVDLRGKLYQLKKAEQKNLPAGRQDVKQQEGSTSKFEPAVYLDIAAEKPNFIHKPGLATGFGSFAFHPAFAKNGLLYTTHVEKPGSAPADFAYADTIKVMLQWVLSEWKTEQPNGFPFKGTSRELLRVNMVHSFHGVQEITFNPLSKPGNEDYGLLYIGIGDGSSVEMGYPFLAHSKKQILGTIIRIDPSGNNSRNGNYGIPKTNPFSNESNSEILKEIYAYGFRNPHRISWSRNGDILASNIGHHRVEALNIILPGADYGWPEREGTFEMRYTNNMDVVHPLPKDDSTNHFTYPVAQYDHDEGNAISGGLEYWGNQLQALKGKYIFGDIVKGRLFFVEMKDLKVGKQAPIHEFVFTLNGKKTNLVALTGEDKVDVRFGRDHTGEMYILTKPDGKVYKIAGAKFSTAEKR